MLLINSQIYNSVGSLNELVEIDEREESSDRCWRFEFRQ